MKQYFRYILFISLLNILVLGASVVLSSIGILDVKLADIILLSVLFSIVTIITLGIFFRGQTKKADSQTIHTMVAITIKFLLELILALIWFFIVKNLTFHSVLIFFVLYLALTLFSISIILKTLRDNFL